MIKKVAVGVAIFVTGSLAGLVGAAVLQEVADRQVNDYFKHLRPTKDEHDRADSDARDS